MYRLYLLYIGMLRPSVRLGIVHMTAWMF